MLYDAGETFTLADASTPRCVFNARPSEDLDMTGVRHEIVGEASDLSSVAVDQSITRDATSTAYTVRERYDDGVGLTVLRVTPA